VTTPLEGPIRIELSVYAGKGAARIENPQTPALQDQFSGKSPAEAAALVPVSFPAYSTAQSAACAEALEAALASSASERTRAIRALLTLGETACLHAWQVLHAWPHCLKAPEPAMAAASIERLHLIGQELNRCAGAEVFRPAGAEPVIDAAGLGHAIAELTALLGEAIFGELPSEWLSRGNAEALSFWAQRNETPAQTIFEYLVQTGMADAGGAEIAPLPPLKPQDLAACLFGDNAAAFMARPEWEGGSRETTPLTRVMDRSVIASAASHYGYGLLTRMTACLTELAEIPSRMQALAAALAEKAPGAAPSSTSRASGIGIGFAEAAPGLLIHAVELADGRVRRYHVLTPAAWNFHPQGAAARGLAAIALAPPKRRDALARLFLTAIDPCAGYDLCLD
jgi:hypothetical protein